MGWLSWLFPTEEDRLNKARQHLANQDFHLARDEVAGLESQAARALHSEAMYGLMKRNIDEALRYAESGGIARAQEHLLLAEELAPPGDPSVRMARRAVREARDAYIAAAQARPREPLTPEGDDPLYSLPPDDPRLRFAMQLEGYPEALRERLLAQGPGLAAAVMAIDENQAQRAWDGLAEFTAKEPAAHFERARAAIALNQPGMAASELRQFGKALGHQRVGAQHTAVMMAESLGASGQLVEARQVLDEAAKQDPKDLNVSLSRALVMEAQGQLAEADEAARGMAREHPRQLALYKLMARVRLRGGKRLEAMQALEAGLNTCCASGQCGTQPFDPEVGRTLARLYLEDRIEPARAAELLAKVRAVTQEPSWIDGYLEALQARNRDAAELPLMVNALGQGLPEGDPRRTMLIEAFRG